MLIQRTITIFKTIIATIIIIVMTVMMIIFSLNLRFLFVNQRIYNYSPTLTIILSVGGLITRDVCISFHQFESSGFYHSLLRMQNIYQVFLIRRVIVLFTIKFKTSLHKSKFPTAVTIKLSLLIITITLKLIYLHNKLCTYLRAHQVTVDNVSLNDQNFS